AVHSGLALLTDSGGYLHCLDAKTGQRYWTHDLEGSATASPLVADGKVSVGTENEMVVVLALAKTKQVLATIDMQARVRASAVFANGVLYVISGAKMFAIQGPGQGARAPGHWPQWRGADRTNRSAETGLLKKWPKEGPPLAWQVTGVGEAPGAVGVA